jgi:hypothetical protein
MAEGVRVELTRLLRSSVFKTAAIAGCWLALPETRAGEGEPFMRRVQPVLSG